MKGISRNAIPLAALALSVASLAAPARAKQPPASRARFLANLRAHVRHVFVIYQENRSFDSYFGTFPGVDNLATAQARRHGFRQYDPIGKTWVTPFAITAPDTADPDHARGVLIAKSDHGRMDRFVAEEEQSAIARGANPAYARDLGRLSMAHEDCRTIPFLWLYAHRFALYDHIFQGMYGPSTPGNIDLVAGQTGQTQWARNPKQAVQPDIAGSGEPVLNDIDPDWGPYAHGEPRARQIDQTYATVLLTLFGDKATLAKADSGAIRQDIGVLSKLGARKIPWGWYQEGFGNGTGNDHPAYIPHHDAPQYFGYIRLNQPLWSGVHDLTDFFTVIERGQLPARSVDFIKGGLHNPFGWRPANPSAAAQPHFLGDDDHPGYSDSQISESLVAKVVNAVAHSPYWKDSAIMILWDDSGGFYDHVPPPQFETCPDHHPCGDGPRIPFILISPYARSGAVVSSPGDQASFPKFLEALFQLPPLASLPDEKPYLPEGPRDTNPRLTNLLGGFDAARLSGAKRPIPAIEAEIPDSVVNRFPAPMTCSEVGVTPVALAGAAAAPPKGFDPLPIFVKRDPPHPGGKFNHR
ncbi:MAG TPA: alkaline phosphatase family protein [Candidatus Dormibacteraeota bacterium]|nr:alkaline phosphatase family protein [Candidatus Dormibacteraeota bacterium]